MNTLDQKFSENQLFVCNDIPNAVDVQRLNPGYHLHRESHVSDVRIEDRKSAQHDVDEAYCSVLDESAFSYSYDYACGIMMVYPSKQSVSSVRYTQQLAAASKA